MLRGFLKREKGALGVDPEQTVEIRLGEIENRLTDQFKAGIRHDNIETAEFLQSGTDKRSISATFEMSA